MKNKTLIWILLIASLAVTFLAAIFYYLKFEGYGTSNDPESWAQFGDYFGGILNPLLAVLNLILLTYLSLRLVKNEEERNKWTLQELARPYADFNFDRGFDYIKIELLNIGLGPMIITKIEIKNAHGDIFNDFSSLIKSLDFKEPKETTGNEDIKIRSFNISNSHAAVGKDKKVTLLKILVAEDCKVSNIFIEFLKTEFLNFSIYVSYEDMYGRKMKDLSDVVNFD